MNIHSTTLWAVISHEMVSKHMQIETLVFHFEEGTKQELNVDSVERKRFGITTNLLAKVLGMGIDENIGQCKHVATYERYEWGLEVKLDKAYTEAELFPTRQVELAGEIAVAHFDTSVLGFSLDGVNGLDIVIKY